MDSWPRHWWQNRWVGVAAAIYAEACGGLAYTFSIYSDHLKETLNCSQQDIDILSSSKDFGGNTGVVAGFLYPLFPPWVSVLIGGTVNLVGYLTVFFTSTRMVTIPFWMLSLAFVVGANGETWIGTAVLVTSLQTFPTERGVIVGLLKSYIGLSGAMFARVYKSFFEPHSNPYILIQAVAPFVVAVLVMLLIKPYPLTRDNDPADNARRFRWSYATVVLLMVYLMITIILQEMVQVDQSMAAVLTFIMLLILVLPAVVPFIGTHHYSRLDTSDEEPPPPGVKTWSGSLSPRHTQSPQVSLESVLDTEPVAVAVLLEGNEEQEEEEDAGGLHRGAAVGKAQMPEVTLLTGIKTLDFWLLYLAIAAGTGAGLTVINNLAQMGKALGSTSVASFVSLISIWNCAGRLLAGYTSEWVVHAGLPRPILLTLAVAVMGVTQLLLATGEVITLYIGSVLVGLSYGAHWTLIPAITSEMFGLKHFSSIYNVVTISSPMAAYFMSTWVAGYLYDQEARRQHSHMPIPTASDGSVPSGSDDPLTCLGPSCFRATLLILAAVCAGGTACGVALVLRTRRLYSGAVIQEIQELEEVEKTL